MTTITLPKHSPHAATRRRALWLMLAIAPLTSLPAYADLKWDAGGAHPTAPVDGAGTWNTTAWSNGTTDLAWPNDTTIADFGSANGAAGTITLGVPITAGGLAFTAASSGNYTITGSTLTLSGPATITATGALAPTISSTLAGTAGLNYTGSIGATIGTLILSAANTYSGTTTLNAGLVQTSNNAAFGTSAVTVLSGADAQVGTSAALTVTNNFTITGTGTSSTSAGAVVLRGTISGNITLNGNARIGDLGFGDTLSGAITGTGNLEFFSSASGSSTFTINNAANAWIGTTTITNNSTTANGTILKMGASNILPTANGLVINAMGTGFAELDLSGRSETVAGLSSAGVAINDKIINSSTGTGSLIINSSSNTLFVGTILAGTGTGVTNIVKSGTGTQTFGGANTYIGTTTINQGVLAITGSLAAGSAVTVNNSGTLAGSGTVAGSVLVNNGGAITGAAGGTLALTGGLTLDNLTTDSETLNLTANASAPTTASLAITGGTGFTINSTSTTVNVTSTGALSTGQYALLTYSATSGTPITSAFTLGTLPQRVAASLDASTAGVLNVTVTGVDFPVWSGAVSIAWTTGATVQTGSPDNWVLNSNNATPTNFVSTDNVLFNDSAANTSVDISSGNVVPGSIIFNNTAKDFTITGTNGISGATTLVKNGAGALTLNNANTYTGGTTLNAGTLNINNPSAIGTGPIVIAGGTLDNTSGSPLTLSTNNPQTWNADIHFIGTNSLNLGTGAVTLAANRTITVDQNTLTVGGSIGGNFGLTKAGAGVLLLSGSNTYTGLTTISAGSIMITNSSALGAFSGAGVVINGGTLDVGGDPSANNVQFNTTNSNGLPFTIAGTGSNGAGAVTNSNANVTQFNTFRGSNVTLSADALITGNRIDIGRDGAAFSTLDLAGHTLTLSMSGSQPMFGIENHGSVTAGNIVVAQGTLDIEQSAGVPDTGGTSTITFNSGANAQFWQTAGTNVSRPMIFNGNNTLGSGSAAATAIVNAPLMLKGNVTLEAVANGIPSPTATNALALAGNITESGGSFSVTKAGASTATLSGTNTYSGGTTVSGGTLIATNEQAFGSGALSVDAGSVQLQTGFAKAMVLSSVVVDGTGSLDIANDKLVVQAASDKATILAGLQAVAHSTIISSSAAPNYAVAVIDNAVLPTPFTTFGGQTVDSNSILVSAEIAGDSNADGQVDLTDLSTVLNNFGSLTLSWTSGNFDGAPTIDLTDLSDVLNNFGATNANAFASGGSSGAVAAIATPEPASLTVLGLGAAAMMIRRKRS